MGGRQWEAACDADSTIKDCASLMAGHDFGAHILPDGTALVHRRSGAQCAVQRAVRAVGAHHRAVVEEHSLRPCHAPRAHS